MDPYLREDIKKLIDDHWQKIKYNYDMVIEDLENRTTGLKHRAPEISLSRLSNEYYFVHRIRRLHTSLFGPSPRWVITCSRINKYNPERKSCIDSTTMEYMINLVDRENILSGVKI